MATAERFTAFAADFEQTYEDDDWSRLEPHLHPDVRYHVENASFGCEIEGREAVLAGMRKSVDGFDRRMDSRTIALRGAPVVEGETLDVAWTVTYTKAGAPNFDLVGATHARVEGDLIVAMTDRYEDGISDAAAAWIEAHAPGLDPSYT